jgi:hypothetical protein
MINKSAMLRIISWEYGMGTAEKKITDVVPVPIGLKE